jgi:(p)ppGpp synthase/HD superfamily hydrolase
VAQINQTLLLRAQAFATDAHSGQTYGEDPYTVHLAAVSSIARRYEQALAIQIAAWLHDILEDTPVTLHTLKAEFGDSIAELVWAVTNEGTGTRMEKAQRTLPKIRGKGTPAVALKLCDRIANVEASLGTPYLSMYKDEYKLFHGILYEAYELEHMWFRLDHLLVTSS